MTPKKIAVLSLAGLMSVTAAATVLAATMTPDQYVAERQAAMKADGKALKGAANFTGEQAVAALATVQKNYARLPGLFPNKETITDKSEALPVIWDQFDQFTAIFKKGDTAAATGIAAAKAGDTAGYKAAVKLVAATCKDCHDTFRAEDD